VLFRALTLEFGGPTSKERKGEKRGRQGREEKKGREREEKTKDKREGKGKGVEAFLPN